jgi:hypothetical protein
MSRSRCVPVVGAIALVIASASSASAQATPPSPFWIEAPAIVTNSSNSGVADTTTCPPGPQACRQTDPAGSAKELGPINSSSTKLGVINSAPKPMLGDTNPNAQVDLNAIWTQSVIGDSGHIWFYFGWSRDSSSGSGLISVEIEKSPVAGCTYPTPNLSSCNPWAGRQAGDFILLWDQQGSSRTIYFRQFQTVSGKLVLGNAIALDATVAIAQYCASGFCGEAAIDLTGIGIFPETPTSCTTFANIIPGTVTGNSDSADYKDVVLANFPSIANCGTVRVTKRTYDPTGTTEITSLTDSAGTFTYTLTRAGGAPLRHTAIAPDSTTSISRTLGFDGDNQAHSDLIPAPPNYHLVETGAPTLEPRWTFDSIVCTIPGDATTYTNVDFPVVAAKTTSCTIKNRQVLGDTSFTTTPQVRALLADTVSVTLANSVSNGTIATVNFKLYSGNACAEQGGVLLAERNVDVTFNGTAGSSSFGVFTEYLNATAKDVTGTFSWLVSVPVVGLNKAKSSCGEITTWNWSFNP